MKISTLCHWLDQGKRPLGLAALLCAMGLLAWLLPAMLGCLVLAPALLLGAVYAVWRGFGFGQCGAGWMREPRPADALAETVLVDAELLGEGLCMQAAAQPVNAMPEMSLRMGSGALLLGTAMTLLSDEVSAADRAAIHAGVTKINIRPDRMKQHSPILRRDKTAEYTSVTVPDGQSERTYYLAEADALAHLCKGIWEDGERPITANDRVRIQDAARYMREGGCRVLAYATAQGDERPTFLGLCGMGQRVRPNAAENLAGLRDLGLTVMLRDAADEQVDAAYLRRVLDVPDVHAKADVYLTAGREAPVAGTLTWLAQEDVPLYAPLAEMKRHFRRAEGMLTRFAQLLAILLGCCVLAGNEWAALAVTLILLAGAWRFGLPEGVKWRPVTAIVPLAASLLFRLFLAAVAPAAALGSGAVLCAGLALAAAFSLHGRAFSTMQTAQWAPVTVLAILAAALGGWLFGATVLTALLGLLVAGIVTVSAVFFWNNGRFF